MNLDPQQLRLDGIYQQRNADRFMQRIKLPAGAFSSLQAMLIADLAEGFAGGRMHLTCRGSIELHDLAGTDLAEVNRRLAGAGLTGRGACGGAVRGISCSTSFSSHFPACQSLARRLHRHFTGNPWFEGLPKKFKIGVDGDGRRGRQLIQDVGLVYAGEKDGEPLWDLWCAGGLGREPQAAFLLGERIRETRLLPLIEGIVRVYRDHSPPGKRLKHLLREIGEAEFRRLLRGATGDAPAPPMDGGLGQLVTGPSREAALVVKVFAGELEASRLRRIAGLAERHAGAALLVTADQDLALLPQNSADHAALAGALQADGFQLGSPDTPGLRVCPGSHECRMGLAPTREVARRLLGVYPTLDRSIAIAGCPNGCPQPQLADVGILPTRFAKSADGRRSARYDLLRRTGPELGRTLLSDLDEEQLFQALVQQFPAGLDPAS